MKPIFTSLVIFISTMAFAQQKDYEPNDANPYGSLNPDAPTAIGVYELLIGTCDCKFVSRKQDGTWKDDSVKMEWKFKYIMNGTAVQDEVWRENGQMAGSLRQYNADSSKWYVSYYTNTSIPASLPAWSGATNEAGDIVLYRDKQAPNGTDGFSRLTFHNISADGFDWKGEWISLDESTVYPFWMITCAKRRKK